MTLKFTKMHGAGNDFVVLDGVRQSIALSPEQIRFIADRHFGIGCDQILLVEKTPRDDADFRYRILPVRPLVSEVLGEKAWPDLESLPELPDIVEVFRAPEHVPAIVESCIRLGIRNLWLQEGVIHEAAAQRAREAGITVVMDRCMWKDCVQLCEHQT